MTTKLLLLATLASSACTCKCTCASNGAGSSRVHLHLQATCKRLASDFETDCDHSPGLFRVFALVAVRLVVAGVVLQVVGGRVG